MLCIIKKLLNNAVRCATEKSQRRSGNSLFHRFCRIMNSSTGEQFIPTCICFRENATQALISHHSIRSIIYSLARISHTARNATTSKPFLVSKFVRPSHSGFIVLCTASYYVFYRFRRLILFYAR
jgi:hypothetical protein